MQAKRYEAKLVDYGDLLGRIKEEMGPDVLIQTRRFQRGGFLGLFGVQEWIEVLAAPKSQAKDRVEISGDAAPRAGGQVEPGRRYVGAPPRVFAAERRVETQETSAASVNSGSSNGNGKDSIAAEIRQLKSLVEGLAQKLEGLERETKSFKPAAETASASAPETKSRIERTVLNEVISWDISPDRAAKLVEKAIALNPANKEALTPEMLMNRVKRVVISEILLAGGVKLPAAGQGMTIAFIGATGVGKTTTIAKLAAQWGIKEGRKIALVSLDTYRIAAAEQLRTYADIMKMPISIVFTPKEFGDAVAKYAKDHLVLVDTAGRSPFNVEHMEDLRNYFRVAAPDATELVIDAHTKADDIRLMLEKFSGIGFDHIIVSKLDETGSLGSVYAINCLTNRPVSYFTIGQKVPDDIRAASVDFIQKWAATGKV
ncbi:MAG: flagellar biosynthesis protein FlhF [bacterium]|jgi:flagellar biosynthesis protein FlhF